MKKRADLPIWKYFWNLDYIHVQDVDIEELYVIVISLLASKVNLARVVTASQ